MKTCAIVTPPRSTGVGLTDHTLSHPLAAGSTECARLPGNPTKGKQLTNVRAAAADDVIKLKPPRDLTLEYAIEWIEDDELVEVTPDAIRVRKRHLTESDRRIAAKKVRAGN